MIATIPTGTTTCNSFPSPCAAVDMLSDVRDRLFVKMLLEVLTIDDVRYGALARVFVGATTSVKTDVGESVNVGAAVMTALEFESYSLFCWSAFAC